MAILVGNNLPVAQRLAIPAVCLLIAFEAYTSQWLYATSPQLAPGPLTTRESNIFNTLLVCLWISYFRACTVDPGRYVFPSPKKTDDLPSSRAPTSISSPSDERRKRRYCTKCAAPKPPRAHHCKACKRCIPRMDHHCPWTGNCVSLQTFPHFLRFLVFTNVCLWMHLGFIWRRFYGLYEARNMPSYLGPSLGQMGFLTVHAFFGGMTALALGILLITTIKSWLFNTTMIEGWEIERHEAVLERRYYSEGGSDDDSSWWRSGERAPGGDTGAAHLAIDPVEFPYDIGIFANMAQAMGTRNVLLWFFPLAGGPRIAPYPGDNSSNNNYNIHDGQQQQGKRRDTTGWEYEENDLNDAPGMWPPPDPDRIRHAKAWKRRDLQKELDEQKLYEADLTPEQRKEAFRQRQERDYQRWAGRGSGGGGRGVVGSNRDTVGLTRSGIIGELEELPTSAAKSRRAVVVDEGKSGWVNADGEHLGDYGVDEDAEFEDDLAVPPAYDDDNEDDNYDDGDDDDEGVVYGAEHGYYEEELDAVLVPAAGEVGGGDYEDEDVPLAELVRRRKTGASSS